MRSIAGRSRRNLWLSLSLAVVVAVSFGLYWFQPWKLFTSRTVNESLPSISVAASVAAASEPNDGERVPGSAAGTARAGTGTPRVQATRASTPATAPQRGTAGNRPPGTRLTPGDARPPVPSSGTTPSTSAIPRTSGPVDPTQITTQIAVGKLISHEHESSGTVRLVKLPDGSRALTLEDLKTSDGPDVHVWLAVAPVVAGEKGWYVFDDLEHVDLGSLKGNLGNQVYAIPEGIDLDSYPSVTLWCERFSVSFGAATLT